MIITTTPDVQDRPVREYLSIVTGEVLGAQNGMLMVTAAGATMKLQAK